MKENRINRVGRPSKEGADKLSGVSFLLSVVVLLGLLLLIAITVVAGVIVYDMSEYIVSLPDYVYLAHMQIPVLIFCEAILVLFIAAFILMIPFFIKVIRKQFYTQKSIFLIRLIGLCFYLMVLPAVALVLYTEANVPASITNLYVCAGIIIAVVIGSIFWLFAALIQEGRHYKEENELTI